ncbi:MAG: bifunctional tetrahydrofolate synthase/dihydrofolate synthase [Proteobacteria bacterium]|nr:bifunctional tetrahydrofolate synthase/dihydrofolate synthase [Pseudomonadota bacterium]
MRGEGLNGLSSNSSLPTWLLYLENLHPKGQAGIELGLERVRRVKAELGQSQHCPVIIVGGTNGKGSTCATLESILTFSGYRVGCYTSPHLFKYNERVRLNGTPVEDQALCAAFARVEVARQQAERAALTYFEFGTLAAWEVFAAAGVDVAILEVGLGGRLDAVNVYDAGVAIVTTVDLDHTDWLGDSRASIGFEKAGIFRAGKPALCADPSPPQSLLDHAGALGADLRLIGREFGVELVEDQQNWQWWCQAGENVIRHQFELPAMPGGGQLRNAAVALAALQCLHDPLPVTLAAIERGLRETVVPGRFQIVQQKPLIIIDVAHNPQAVWELAANLDRLPVAGRTHAIVGMLADKDAGAALAVLKGKIDVWHLATLEGWRGAPAQRLAAIIAELALGGEVFLYPSPQMAMQTVQGSAAESDRILAFGSFHTVAGVMDTLGYGR